MIFGLLGAPSGVFAQETSSTGSSILQASNSVVLDNTVPLLKGGIKTKAAKKIHSGDDDDDSDTSGSTDDGSGWWIAIIIIIIIIAIIVLAVWFFFLRK
ncbi:MAG: hypothetical protein ABFD07_00765 [Methanobacterium sp.]